MREIAFDLGHNIETTAVSGVANYSIQKVGGTHIYTIEDLSSNVALRYTRPGYELQISPVFSLSMYADEANNDELAVETADILIPSSAVTDHASARQAVAGILAQFRRGKWRRYISPDCPGVTGRSALLDGSGSIDLKNTCALDPDYELSQEDWIAAMRVGQSFEWIGDGVKAQLSIRYSLSRASPAYDITLELTNAKISARRENAKLAERLKKGDAAGWNTSKEYADQMLQRQQEIKELRRNAIERGDKVLSNP